MMNNQNSFSHPISQEIAVLKKRIQFQHQKLNSNEQKIIELKAKIQNAKQRNLQKRDMLTQVQQKVIQEKEKGQHVQSSESDQDSQYQNIQKASQSSALLSESSSPILQQLRQHFKALKMQMMSELLGSQQEDQYEDQVDVDNMTYQQLLELGQKIGKVSKGLDLKKIESLKIKKYQHQSQSQTVECAICREVLQTAEQYIELHCKHMFHNQCIKGWLNMQKHCPNCKRDIHVQQHHSGKKELEH